jgi:hypothetical protein
MIESAESSPSFYPTSYCWQEGYRLRGLYRPKMEDLHMFLFEFDQLFKTLLPVLWDHFNDHGVTPSMYASSWFMTLFGNVFTMPLANRIMDLFLLDGLIVVFQVALAILQSNRCVVVVCCCCCCCSIHLFLLCLSVSLSFCLTPSFSIREMLLRQNFEHILAFLARSGLRQTYASNYEDLISRGL